MMRRKRITVDEFLEYLHQEDVTRFVQYEESVNEKYITFCNTLRMKRTEGKRNIVFERFEITAMQGGRWILETASKYKKITDMLTILFLRNAGNDRALIQQILFYCVKSRVDQLLAQGYVITGTTHIQLVAQHAGWKRNRTVWVPEYFVTRRDCVKKSLIAKFEVKETPVLRIKRSIDISEDNNFYSYIVWRLKYKINQGYRNSAKLINKSVRDLLDKEVLSNTFKYKVETYGTTAFQVTLSDYIHFSSKFVVTGDCGSLIPLLRLVETRRVTKIDGSNKSFISALSDFRHSRIK